MAMYELLTSPTLTVETPFSLFAASADAPALSNISTPLPLMRVLADVPLYPTSSPVESSKCR